MSSKIGSANTVPATQPLTPILIPSKIDSKDILEPGANPPEQSWCSKLIQKVKKFFKAILYYLTCRCCYKKEEITEKTNFVKPAAPNLPKPIEFSAVQIDRKAEVRDGYGELILRVKEGNTFRPATKEECAKAYQIFQKHVPRLDGTKKLDRSRIELIRNDLKEINPNLVGTFIPRTLFDLFFIQASIAEDLEKARTFSFQNPQNPTEDELHSLRAACYTNQNSWCNTEMLLKGIKIPAALKIQTLADVQKQNVRLLELATRLNTYACLALEKTGRENLTMGQIEGLVEEQIRFMNEVQKHPRARDIPNTQEPGPSSNFMNAHSYRGGMKPMAVSTNKAVQIIKNAALMESLPTSIGKVILYRGANFAKDSPDRSGPNSLSFGTSLFAGVVNDGGATAYSYMRNEELDAYALPVDLNEENSELFYLPSLTAMESLYGHGESFHARSKAYSDHTTNHIGGFLGSDGLQKDTQERLFRSSLPKEELLKRYQRQEKLVLAGN